MWSILYFHVFSLSADTNNLEEEFFNLSAGNWLYEIVKLICSSNLLYICSCFFICCITLQAHLSQILSDFTVKCLKQQEILTNLFRELSVSELRQIKKKPTKPNQTPKPKPQPTNEFLIFAVLYCDRAFVHTNWRNAKAVKNRSLILQCMFLKVEWLRIRWFLGTYSGIFPSKNKECLSRFPRKFTLVLTTAACSQKYVGVWSQKLSLQGPRAHHLFHC